jgi:hypothetical protein
MKLNLKYNIISNIKTIIPSEKYCCLHCFGKVGRLKRGQMGESEEHL